MMGMPAAPAPERPPLRPAASGLSPALFDDLAPPPAAPAPVSPMVDVPTPMGVRPREPESQMQARPGDRAAEGSSTFAQKLDQKMAEVAARGPEYAAIVHLSRDIIEQVVWEVVPELAEVMIREQIDRLAKR